MSMPVTTVLTFVVPAVATGIFVVNGFRLLFYPRRSAERYAALHERRGQPRLAAYARGGMQRFTTRFVGLVCIVVPSALLILMICHRLRG